MIKIGRAGVINNGEYKGWQITVQDDSKSTGGFLILIAKIENNITIEAYDDWVESKEALESYFNEAQYSIKWQQP